MKRYLSHLSPGDFFLHSGKVWIKSELITNESYQTQEYYILGQFSPHVEFIYEAHFACLDLLSGNVRSFSQTMLVETVAVDLTIHQ